MKTETQEINVIKFIETVLIKNIDQMVNDCKLYYLSFGIIAQGIEFLGACLDEMPFNEKHQSEKRFKKAIEKLFSSINKNYTKYNSKGSEYYLYEGLRCGLVHMMRPQNKIFLTHKKESEKERTNHLEQHGENLVLVAEDLYEDFKKACEKLIFQIKEKKLSNNKISQNYIVIKDLSRKC